MGKIRPLTTDTLHEMLSYNKRTGILKWKVPAHPRIKRNAIAGSIKSNGYRSIRVNGKYVSEHRLIWYYVFGKWPQKEIDHINGAKSDNRISNLREVTRSENCLAARKKKFSTRSPFRGVERAGKRWRATITQDGRTMHLGVFDTPRDADIAYQAAYNLLWNLTYGKTAGVTK